MIHTFKPIYNDHSRILILGTFPSVKSREGNFYYQHPQNRFWKLISILIGVETPETIQEKTDILQDAGVALWDVIHSCDIKGSSDQSISNVIPNNIKGLLNETTIEAIYANGGKAYELYNRFCYDKTHKEIIKLPSTSPANARYSLDKLLAVWTKEIMLG
jgi:hypoxanthine-DNA glycosylase